MREVVSLAHAHRLVTIAGAAGAGKTQTALQSAVFLREADAWDVRYAGLAAIGDSALVPAAIASAAGLNDVPHAPFGDALIAFVNGKKLLLVVDDCEGIASGVAAFLSAILAGTTEVRVIAACREPLGIPGEQVYRLPPLSHGQACALFTERSASFDRAFDPTGKTAAIAGICRRLDGIAGAIELAAARADTLTLETIEQSLEEPFSRAATSAPRPETMRVALEWSYALLNDLERTLFRRLGVFAGSFDLEAVERICAGGIDALALRGALSVLAHMGLVYGEPSTERYRLLQPAREFAAQRLSESGERELRAAAWARYFCDRAIAARRRYEVGRTKESTATFVADLDNYRAVLHWTLLESNDVAAGAALASALAPYWTQIRAGAEGAVWIDRALALVDESAKPALAARLWNARGWLAGADARHEIGRRALSLAETAGDAESAAWALTFVAGGLQRAGHSGEALQTYSRALEVMRARANARGIATVLAGEAAVYREREDHDEARARLAEALRELQALGDDCGPVAAELAELEFACGNPKRALELTKETPDGDRVRRCAYRLALGQLEFARADARKALQSALHARDDLTIAVVLQHFALVEALAGEMRTAARLRGYVDARYGDLRYRRGLTEEWSYQHLIEALQSRLSVSEIVALAAQGAAWSERRAILEATRA